MFGQSCDFTPRYLAVVSTNTGKHVRKEVPNPFDNFHMSQEKLHTREQLGDAVRLVALDDFFELAQGDQMDGKYGHACGCANPGH